MPNEVDQRLDRLEHEMTGLLAYFNMGKGIGRFLVVLGGIMVGVAGVYSAVATFLHR